MSEEGLLIGPSANRPCGVGSADLAYSRLDKLRVRGGGGTARSNSRPIFHKRTRQSCGKRVETSSNQIARMRELRFASLIPMSARGYQ